MLHDTLELVRETVRERGIDLDAIERDAGGRSDDVDERSPAVNLIAHASKHYAEAVDSWFDSNAGLFAEKEWELNQIRSATPGSDPSAEAVGINDATEIVQWYQHQIHVKLRRAIESARNEKEEINTLMSGVSGAAIFPKAYFPKR